MVIAGQQFYDLPCRVNLVEFVGWIFYDDACFDDKQLSICADTVRNLNTKTKRNSIICYRELHKSAPVG